MTQEDELPCLDELTLRRFPKKMLGACVACGEARDAGRDKDIRLSIEFQDVYISLCPAHEGELLEALLKNYLRRKSKASKTGYCGALVKPDAAELAEEDEEDLDFEVEA